MKIIGITGSIGMGKTTISSMLKLLGIPIFDSDKYVGIILEENNSVIEKIFKYGLIRFCNAKKEKNR